ncbi:hypothetical protein BHM03_00057074 [Ensete ventricosum]|nr:hypothetical protein BHM03_00057074 [Ensete ventricosum]
MGRLHDPLPLSSPPLLLFTTSLLSLLFDVVTAVASLHHAAVAALHCRRCRSCRSRSGQLVASFLLLSVASFRSRSTPRLISTVNLLLT